VRALRRDGFAGAPEAAPFDRVVATVGCPDVSPRWTEQLTDDGFILVPLRHAGANPLVRVQREDGGLAGRVVGMSGFMAVQGALADPAYYAASHAPAATDGAEQERPLWPELRERRLDFWFYLGLRDPRARLFRWFSSFGLQDAASDTSARIEEDQFVGDPRLVDAAAHRPTGWAPRRRHRALGVEDDGWTIDGHAADDQTGRDGHHRPTPELDSGAPAGTSRASCAMLARESPVCPSSASLTRRTPVWCGGASCRRSGHGHADSGSARRASRSGAGRVRPGVGLRHGGRGGRRGMRLF
jgi:hypothetical protein